MSSQGFPSSGELLTHPSITEFAHRRRILSRTMHKGRRTLEPGVRRPAAQAITVGTLGSVPLTARPAGSAAA
jgi:hypothetical protein